MKLTLYFLFGFLSICSAKFAISQNVTIEYLVLYALQTPNEFNTSVIELGYDYKGPINNDIVEGQIYYKNGKNGGSLAQNYLIRYRKYRKEYYTTIGFQTSNYIEANDFVQSIKKYDFEYVKTDKVGSVLFEYYRKRGLGFGYILERIIDPTRPGISEFNLTYMPNN